MSDKIMKKVRFPCPICGHLLYYEAWRESSYLVEEVSDCNDCGYYYHYSYGNYEMLVKGNWYDWTYATPHNIPMFKKMDKDFFMAKRNWKKRRKIYKNITSMWV